MYLAALIDWFSRYVVEWQLGDTTEEGLVLEPVRRALGRAQPGVLNSDQGSQFTAAAYVEVIRGPGVVRISMDRRGRALGNIYWPRPKPDGLRARLPYLEVEGQ
ncbi:Integrase catalytic region [mine drainage metagenome]|uniref:Integrase catalytic region n=1 Tax=mine drainage metagenome TaxID=410659 RepID=T0ZPP0_9ZZZZ